jgi:mitochondrial import inner membrane translocase subunit TIM16
MTIGPLARLLAQLAVPVIAVLARALPAAYAQALQNAKKAGMSAEDAAATAMKRHALSKSEALQILNLTEEAATTEAIVKVRTTDTLCAMSCESLDTHYEAVCNN